MWRSRRGRACLRSRWASSSSSSRFHSSSQRRRTGEGRGMPLPTFDIASMSSRWPRKRYSVSREKMRHWCSYAAFKGILGAADSTGRPRRRWMPPLSVDRPCRTQRRNRPRQASTRWHFLPGVCLRHDRLRSQTGRRERRLPPHPYQHGPDDGWRPASAPAGYRTARRCDGLSAFPTCATSRFFAGPAGARATRLHRSCDMIQITLRRCRVRLRLLVGGNM